MFGDQESWNVALEAQAEFKAITVFEIFLCFFPNMHFGFFVLVYVFDRQPSKWQVRRQKPEMPRS